MMKNNETVNDLMRGLSFEDDRIKFKTLVSQI